MKIDFRNNSLIILLTVAYIVVLFLAIITFDLQYYQRAKKELIEERYFEHFPIENRTLQSLVEEFLRTEDPERRENLRSRISEEMLRFFEAEPDAPIIAIRVSREGQTLVEEMREGGAREFNDFSNSLVLRDFTGTIKRKFRFPMFPYTVMGDLVFIYTTPRDFEPVVSLTQRYWGYLAGLLALLTLSYLLMMRFLILPIKTVTEAIQSSRGRVAQFIERPRSRLERLYNVMARDALLNAISIGLRNPKTRQLRMTLSDLFEFLAPRINEWFGFDGVWLFDMVWEGPAKLSPVRQLPPETNDDPAWHNLADAFDASLVRNLQTSWESKAAQLFHTEIEKPRRGYLFAGVLPGAESDSQMRVLTIVSYTHVEGERLAWLENTADTIYRQVIGLVERMIGQSRELFREKSEANISLSRNLGHDLTNIIATNKLELMTVGHILHGDPTTWFDTEEKAMIMKESLTRLLDNTRSLQQIVNLYRAYEYLKSPRYESIDLNQVIRELIEIFRLSMSGPVDIISDFDPNLPAVSIEPRLVKLALFNLLSNAQDAIRRLPLEEQETAKIFIQTQPCDGRSDMVSVRVSDTGPGIRTSDGVLATAEQLERIFDLGFSTKANGEGEGLGLNWVRTILTEFHPGELMAYNRPEGGATFEFTLPVAPEAAE